MRDMREVIQKYDKSFEKIVQHYNQYGSRPTITSIAKELNLSKQEYQMSLGDW